jgi:hypothetical protein
MFSLIKNCGRLSHAATRAGSSPRRGRTRPGLELLESRDLMSTVVVGPPVPAPPPVGTVPPSHVNPPPGTMPPTYINPPSGTTNG